MTTSDAYRRHCLAGHRHSHPVQLAWSAGRAQVLETQVNYANVCDSLVSGYAPVCERRNDCVRRRNGCAMLPGTSVIEGTQSARRRPLVRRHHHTHQRNHRTSETAGWKEGLRTRRVWVILCVGVHRWDASTMGEGVGIWATPGRL